MTRTFRTPGVLPFTLATLAIVAAVQVGCDRVSDDGGARQLKRERGGNPPTGPVNPAAESALIVAARAGDARQVRQLAADGTDVNGFGNGRQTALMAAAQAGHGDVVDALLEAGADANLRDAKGNTAAEAAAERGHQRLAESLRNAEVKPPKGPAKPVAAPKPQPKTPRQ